MAGEEAISCTSAGNGSAVPLAAGLVVPRAFLGRVRRESRGSGTSRRRGDLIFFLALRIRLVSLAASRSTPRVQRLELAAPPNSKSPLSSISLLVRSARVGEALSLLSCINGCVCTCVTYLPACVSLYLCCRALSRECVSDGGS